MDSKHTPGPWKWSNLYLTLDERSTWSLIGNGGYGILSCDGDGNSPQGLGPTGAYNASLIAAAPDLLEALRSAHKFIADQYQSEESIAMDGEFVSREARPVWNSICSAIAKAEG